MAQRFPAAVVMLDLASEMLAGATMEDVSTVLYFKVLQWAGYSRNLKVAALERRIEKDGRYAEFIDRVAAAVARRVRGTDIQNDPLVVDGLVPQMAHEMYPTLSRRRHRSHPAPTDSSSSKIERVQEMIDIVREKSGKENIIFVIDEVGQYVASRDNLILNLDGLAKNLKRLATARSGSSARRSRR